jgi:S-methylmethionine-dependent homocysteine/selenocysteine methylase
MIGFEDTVRDAPLILTDGGIETRIMFETEIPLPPHVQVVALVTDPVGGPALRGIYESYVEAARSYSLPVIIGTPTFRASLNFVRRAELCGAEAVRRLNTDAVAMHREIRDRSDHRPIYVAGVIGPSGDAYRPEESLPVEEAREYHRVQAEALAHSSVDFLYAPTFPAVEEALGVTMAMGDTSLPYVVSFVLERDSRVLDGTSLHEAIERIDGTTLLLDQLPPPLHRRPRSAGRGGVLGPRRPLPVRVRSQRFSFAPRGVGPTRPSRRRRPGPLRHRDVVAAPGLRAARPRRLLRYRRSSHARFGRPDGRYH